MAPRVVKWCKNQQLVADVNERSSHKTPTPSGGGIGFIMAALPIMMAVAWFVPVANPTFLKALMFGGLAVAILGWFDDVKNLPAKLRLLTQVIIVAIGLYFMPALFDNVAWWIEKPLLLLAWVWFLNLFNFMDGIDGYAGMQAAFLAIAISFLVPDLKPIGIVLTGSVLGFLRVNWHPAKIFMGDVGSTFLGYVLGGLLIFSATLDTSTFLLPMFTLPLLFTADATYTLIKRLLKGKKPWEAHREHWYQRAIQLGLSHSQIVIRGIQINLLLFICVLLSIYSQFGPFCLLFGVLLVALAAIKIRYLEGH